MPARKLLSLTNRQFAVRNSEKEKMNQTPMEHTLRVVGIASIVFALLGAAFYWWVPMGMMLSMTGLTLAFVDWVNARRRSSDFRLSIVGMLLSAAALAACIVIAALGLQTVTFGW
jgi:hypothetical protein